MLASGVDQLRTAVELGGELSAEDGEDGEGLGCRASPSPCSGLSEFELEFEFELELPSDAEFELPDFELELPCDEEFGVVAEVVGGWLVGGGELTGVDSGVLIGVVGDVLWCGRAALSTAWAASRIACSL